MPNVETEGVLVGFFADVGGTPTLVAARRGLELEETADPIDISHADNRRAPINVVGLDTGSDEVTIQGDRRRELDTYKEFELRGTAGDDGTYTATGTSLSSGDTVVSVSGGISNGTVGTGRALIVAPYGFMVRCPGEQDWSASLDNVMLLDDNTGSFEASHNALRQSKRNENPIGIQTRYPNADATNPRDESTGLVTSITLTAPYDGEATVAFELEGQEPLVYAT